MTISATAEEQRRYAAFWQRSVAILMDWGFLYVWAWVVARAQATVVPGRYLLPLIQILGILVTWFYFSGFESSRLQGTPGKLALGIRVTDMQGKQISFLRATGRNLGKAVSGLTLGFGFLTAASTSKRQALHDAIASTLVVRRTRNDAQ